MLKRILWLHLVVAVSSMLVLASSSFAESAPRMSTDELKSRLGQADLVVLDVRAGWDWGPATTKIVGAERVDPRAVGKWMSSYHKEKTIVLYCA